MLDLIIKGGRVVTPEGVGDMDVGVQGERIAALALPGTLEVEARRTIDAGGKVLLPGGIEPHTHIGIPVPETWAGRSEVLTQPPEAASRAAAFGGVTTFVDFSGELPGSQPSTDPIILRLEKRREAFTGHSYTDFSTTTSSPERSPTPPSARSGRPSSQAWPASRSSPRSPKSVSPTAT